MSEWQTVYYRGSRQVKQPPIRKPRVPKGLDTRQFLEKELSSYGDGRYRSVEEACDNLMFNVSGGLPVEDLSGYEVMLLEDRYGASWRKEIYG